MNEKFELKKQIYRICLECKKETCYRPCDKFINLEFENQYRGVEETNEIFQYAVKEVDEIYTYHDKSAFKGQTWKKLIKDQYLLEYSDHSFQQGLKKYFEYDFTYKINQNRLLECFNSLSHEDQEKAIIYIETLAEKNNSKKA